MPDLHPYPGQWVVLNVAFSFADAVTKLGGAQHKALE